MPYWTVPWSHAEEVNSWKRERGSLFSVYAMSVCVRMSMSETVSHKRIRCFSCNVIVTPWAKCILVVFGRVIFPRFLLQIGVVLVLLTVLALLTSAVDVFIEKCVHKDFCLLLFWQPLTGHNDFTPRNRQHDYWLCKVCVLKPWWTSLESPWCSTLMWTKIDCLWPIIIWQW